MDDMDDMKEQLINKGYEGVRQTSLGQWIGVLPSMYTSTLYAILYVGLYEYYYRYGYGYEKRYRYEKKRDALIACEMFNGVGDPTGPWIKWFI